MNETCQRYNHGGPNLSTTCPNQSPDLNGQRCCDPHSFNHANSNLHRWLAWLRAHPGLSTPCRSMRRREERESGLADADIAGHPRLYDD